MVRKKGKYGHETKGLSDNCGKERGCGQTPGCTPQDLCHFGQVSSQLPRSRMSVGILFCFNVFVHTVFTAPRTMPGTQYKRQTVND